MLDLLEGFDVVDLTLGVNSLARTAVVESSVSVLLHFMIDTIIFQRTHLKKQVIKRQGSTSIHSKGRICFFEDFKAFVGWVKKKRDLSA